MAAERARSGAPARSVNASMVSNATTMMSATTPGAPTDARVPDGALIRRSSVLPTFCPEYRRNVRPDTVVGATSFTIAPRTVAAESSTRISKIAAESVDATVIGSPTANV